MSQSNNQYSGPYVKIDGNDLGYLIHGAPFTLEFHFPAANIVWIHNPLPTTRRIEWPIRARGWHRCQATDTWTGTANYYSPFLKIKVFAWNRFWKTETFHFELKIDFPNVRVPQVQSHARAHEMVLNYPTARPKPKTPNINILPSTNRLQAYKPGTLKGLSDTVVCPKPVTIKPNHAQLQRNMLALLKEEVDSNYPIL